MSTESGSPQSGSGVAFRIPRVLCVSEEVALLAELREAFERVNCRVECAPGVAEAHAITRLVSCDLVIAEWRLEGRPGLDWVALIAPEPVLLVLSEEEDTVIVLPPNARGMFRKPFDTNQLVSFAASLLRARDLDVALE